MKTPLCDFAERYENAGAVRLHMPGHKGRLFLGPEARDITEIGGADVLYAANGILAESQKAASLLFSSQKTLYSAEGCTLALRAMLYLACLNAKKEKRRARIAAPRAIHKSFLTTLALLDFDADWLPTESDSLFAAPLTVDRWRQYMKNAPQKPDALLITSPDYLGNVADIAALSAACHEAGVLLLVDNAHGAYTAFLNPSEHPLALGADMACDSAHKTLPVLTGGAYLHLSKRLDKALCDEAERAMALFASTSPSYLVLQSLDAANAILESEFPALLRKELVRVERLKDYFLNKGLSLCGTEKLKITLCPKAYGYTGTDLQVFLRARGIECEFADPDYLVMMLSPYLPDDTEDRLRAAFDALAPKEAIEESPPPLARFEAHLSIREAMLAPSEEVPIDAGVGRILAAPCVSCPPAIPIAVCGERLEKAALDAFRYYGIKRVRVVKEERD